MGKHTKSAMNGKKMPDYNVYTVSEREGYKDFWTQIGVAFGHGDGEMKGMNVLLSALPLDGRLVLRRYTEKPEAEDKKAEKK